MGSLTDDAFLALASSEPRRLLTTLAERESEPDDGLYVPEDVPSEAREAERPGVMMHHVHLPKLEAAGLIDWDQDANRVTRGPQFAEVRPILELLTDDAAVPSEHE